MRWSISDTAEYGDFTRGPRVIDDHVRANMRKVLGEIQDGTFAREWIAEMDAGETNLDELRARRARAADRAGRARAPVADDARASRRRRVSVDVPVALLGYGTVGSAVGRLLAESADDIERATGHRLRVVRALVRDTDKERDFPPTGRRADDGLRRRSATTPRSRSSPR